MNQLYVMLTVILPAKLKQLDERGGGNQSGENVILLAGAIALAVAVVAVIAGVIVKKEGMLQ